jgi:hypothetical protein
VIPELTVDRILYKDIELISYMLRNGEIVEKVREAVA